ncbi:putative phage shock protein E [Pseudoalteromonas luteoviolacea B = ATCC 29581]|nr:putative phage shock protein E [Pseudoalteromonas luteoviolacea B = ATCC 29581]
MKALLLSLLLLSSNVIAKDIKISAEALLANQMSQSPHMIVDVRSEEEFSAGHVKGAINIPFNQLEKYKNVLEQLKGKTAVVYCRSGRRASIFMEAVKDPEIEFFHLEGDIQGWQEKALPLVQ